MLGPLTDDDAGFAALKTELIRITGWELQRFKDNYLRRRVGARVRALGCQTWGDYAEILAKDGAELERLKDRLTVNVTEFLRDSEVWTELRESVLPVLLQKAAQRPVRELRIWSAGCSSGEEPYSLAMLALDCAAGAGLDVDVRVLASDIDPLILARARQGRYPAAAVAGLPPLLRETWFDRDGDGVRVKARLRQAVCFRPLDLFSSPPPPHLDLLLCRNVMIYFSRELQQRLLRAFHQALRPGGIFVTGKTETVLGPVRSAFQCVSARSRIFAKA